MALLSQLLPHGKSLIFTMNSHECVRIQAMCNQLGIQCIAALPSARTAAADAGRELMKRWCAIPENARSVFVSVVPMFSHGVKFQTHRVIWVGDPPEQLSGDRKSLFYQSMGRVDPIWESGPAAIFTIYHVIKPGSE